MLLQAEDRDRYCCDTASTSAMIMSVSSTFLVTSAASFFKFSSVVMMVSSSRIRPLTSLRACSRDFSSWRKRSWNSPTRDRRTVVDQLYHFTELFSNHESSPNDLASPCQCSSSPPAVPCHCVKHICCFLSHPAVWGGRSVSHPHQASQPLGPRWDTGSEGCCVSQWSWQM